jgi:hypothetical protein
VEYAEDQKASSHSWVEAFCVGWVDFEVLAIGLAIKISLEKV